MKNKFYHYGLLIAAIILAAIIFRESFTSYFFQDDWFSLKIAKIRTLDEFIAFFIPRRDVIYYRPLGMQIPFFILQSLFGSIPFPFRLFVFLVHAGNIFLVHQLIKKISGKILAANISAFLYAVSGIHYTVFYWSSTLSFFLGPLFLFSSFYFYLISRSGHKIFYLISLGLFSAALIANEMTVVLPLILLSYTLLVLRKFNLRQLSPFFLLPMILFAVRFLFFPPVISGYYSLGIGRETFYSLRNYFLWSLNWPEEVQGQFYKFGLLNPQFVREFASYVLIFTLTTLVNLFLSFFSVSQLFKNKNSASLHLFWFGIIWYLIGLTPIIFFRFHAFSYYLIISMVGLLLSFSCAFEIFVSPLSKKNNRGTVFFTAMLLISAGVSSIFLVAFNSKIHWAPRRARIAERLIVRAKTYPFDGNKEVIFAVKPDSENKHALNNQDALQFIFKREDIVTSYSFASKYKFNLTD